MRHEMQQCGCGDDGLLSDSLAVTTGATASASTLSNTYNSRMMTTTSAGPTTAGPLVLPTTSVDSTYPLTTDSYYPSLQSNMTDTDGIDAVYIATDAPFGFGYAVLLESEKKQCLKQDSFDVAAGTKPCLSDPGSCTDGLSFSIWEKHYFSADIFNRYDAMTDADIKYVLSTGGDTEGHPGIALYHHGIYQIAVVSTGDKYWKVRVPGQMFNGSWCNIGIRWNPDIVEGTNGVPISGGLHMLINLRVVGHSYLPVAVTAKPGLAPPELMLGCHKTQADTTYRHFGDGEYDELATWNRALPENETFYFLGGYEGNFSNVTPEQMAEMLERVNLKDPDQFAAALTILGKMTQNNEKPTNAPDTTASSTALLDTSPTPSGPNQLGALSEAQSLHRREALLDIMNTILNTDNLGDPDDQLTKAQGVPYLDTLNLASNLLDMNSQHEWHNIQANGSAGAAALMWKLDQFIKAAFCRIRYDNDSAPLTVVKSTKNIIFVGQKMLVEDLRGKGAYVELPNFKMPELKAKKVEWNNIYDSIRVPTGVLNDDRCDKRPICVITMVYDTYDNVGPSPVNIANVPKDTIQKMDSRLVSFKITADKGRLPLYSGAVDKSAALCWPDPVVLTKDPFYFRVEHNTPTVSVTRRGLKFHSEEVVTQVLDRRCAWWNANLSDYGVFDSSGCEIVETSAYSTSCICDRFGIVVVLAEQVKPAEVPPEEYWLTLVKYVLYGISGLLLIFYSVVVLYSPVLKEQFHLLGMNLSLAVLLGSIFMCVSDMHSIRESRHMCTTISTLIHFFYVAAGGLVACLGHASFKAITSGVVGGKLNSYACISWGLALVSVGVPFAFFITDLGTDPRCFISWENYGKATFFLPQMVYVQIAFFFGFVVLCNLSTPALRKENLIDDFGSFCRGASFVMIYFAITWTLGLLAYMRFDLTTDFFPMFQIMNSMMGIIIFLFIGLASNRYRGVLVGKAKAKQQKLMTLGGADGKKKLKEEPISPPPKAVAPADKVPSRPSTVSSLRPPSTGKVAGRPGSRPVTPQL